MGAEQRERSHLKKSIGPFPYALASGLGILLSKLDLDQRRESPNSLRLEEASRPLSPKPRQGRQEKKGKTGESR